MNPEIDYAKVGLKMKELRVAQGITQDKVANDLGTTVAFVSNVENNRTKLNLRVLTYYSNLCHVSVDTLLDAGKPDDAEKWSDTVVDKEIMKVLANYTQEEKQKVLKMLEIGKGIERE